MFNRKVSKFPLLLLIVLFENAFGLGLGIQSGLGLAIGLGLGLRTCRDLPTDRHFRHWRIKISTGETASHAFRHE